MSRDLSSTNIAEIDANHYHDVVLVKLEHSTPVYFHSGIGSITFDSNEYTGIGVFGAIGTAKESHLLGPSPITLSLSGIDASILAGALASGSYGDVVTIYEGYRQDDGTLVDDPWIVWRGKYEFAGAGLGVDNSITITVQNDLAVLKENDGAKFSDEDQQVRYPGDVGMEFVTSAIAPNRLQWGSVIPSTLPWPPNPDGPPELISV